MCLLLRLLTWTCRCTTALQAKLDQSPSSKQVAKTASTGKLIVKEDQEVRQCNEQAAGSEGVQDARAVSSCAAAAMPIVQCCPACPC